jgi:Rab GDP dissociation inhibitor
MRELFRSFKLDANTIDFIGHALALREDDSFLDSPAIDTVKRIKLYAESLARFNTNAPFIYPLYGLGELPQAFARLSAVYGGTYMLDKSDAEVEYDNDGRASGVTSGGETAQASFVVGDPSFFPSKVKTVNKVARAYCILSHPVPNTDEAHSAQIILPQKQLGRSSDMYIFTCSHAYNVASKNKWIALVSATMEGRGDDVEAELQPGLRLLGQIDYKFFDVKEVKEPMNPEEDDGCFISKGYDASTHFESTVDDVLDMYRRMTEEELDLSERDVNEAEVD